MLPRFATLKVVNGHKFSAFSTLSISQTSGETSRPLPSNSIGKLLDSKVAEFPHKNALRSFKEDIRWTFSELNHWTSAVGNGFLHGRIHQGSVLGTYLDNTVDNAVSQIAASKGGIHFVSLNPKSTKEEIEVFLKGVQPRGLLINRDHLSVVQDIVPELKRPGPDSIGSWHYPHLKQVIRNDREDLTDRSTKFEDVMMVNALTDKLAEVSRKTVTPLSPASVRYQSPEQLSVVTQQQLISNGFLVGEHLGLGYEDRVCTDLPFWTTYAQAIVYGSFAHNAVVTIPSNQIGDEESILQCIAVDKCTALFLQPSSLQRIADYPKLGNFDVSSLKQILIVVTPGERYPSQQSLNRLREVTKADVRVGFATADTGFFLLSDANPPKDAIGKSLSHTQSAVLDDKKKAVRIGTTGQLFTKGHHVPANQFSVKGEQGKPAAEEWFPTGIDARVDELGNFYLV